MEVWPGLDYDAILDMPSTRRQRLMAKKADLEKRRSERK
jgi:hypothetical protein